MKHGPPAELSDVDPQAAVLRDIHTLLDLLGTDGIEAGSGDKPAMKALASINARLAEPIAIDLQRGQFRSYPNIQALYLLLLTTGLIRVEGPGAKKKLVLDEVNAAAFRSLNPTEQFGSLLDAWLLKSRLAAIDIPEGWFKDSLTSMINCWGTIRAAGRKSSVQERAASKAPFARDSDRVSLWLMRGFGMIELDQGRPIAGKPWHPQAVERTRFGRALLAVLAHSPALPYYPRRAIIDGWTVFGLTGKPPAQKGIKPPNRSAAPPELRSGISFGTLMPALQPHWPAWQRSHGLAPISSRDGTFVFKVSLNDIWRVIAIPARQTVERLADTILKSVKFDDEHLWDFRLEDRLGGNLIITRPYMDREAEAHGADEVLIRDLPLAIGESMSYTYDYGDNWKFDVKLVRVDDPQPKFKAPRVIGSHGKAPSQYGDWDE
jgi:hypothetical protein